MPPARLAGSGARAREGFHETEAGRTGGGRRGPRRSGTGMISNRIHPAPQADGLGELFASTEARPGQLGVESIEEFRRLLLALQDSRGRRGEPELVHAESLPARPARYAELKEPLHRVIRHVLDGQGISR